MVLFRLLNGFNQLAHVAMHAVLDNGLHLLGKFEVGNKQGMV